MAGVVNVIELVADADGGWVEAVQSAVSQAARTVRNITGVEVTNWTADVKNGQIAEYKVDVKLALGVDSRDQS